MKKMTFLLVLLGAFVIGCTAPKGGQPDFRPKKGPIVIGSKGFTEQIILAKMTSIYLRENGFDTIEVTGMGSPVIRNALEHGYIHLYWEYTGTGLMLFYRHPKETDGETTFQKVKALDAQKGLIWLDRARLNNSYTILMRKDRAQAKGIRTLSNLAAYVNLNPGDLIFGSNREFVSRTDGLKGLENAYGFRFPTSNIIIIDTGLTYIYLKEKAVDVAMGFTTDGRVTGYELIPLEDDRNYFPPYEAAPVVRREVLDMYPEIAGLMRDITSRLHTEVMTQLNSRVDVERQEAFLVAREWLIANGLIKARQASPR